MDTYWFNGREQEVRLFTPEGKRDGWIWVHSDLQLSNPQTAISVLGRAVEDVESLGIPLDGVWNLGDSLCHANEANLDEVASASVELLERLGVPIAYVMGNHEMDLALSGCWRFPLYERVKSRPLWHVNEQLSDMGFVRDCFGMRIFFSGDHADPDGKWMVIHDWPTPVEPYPNLPEGWQRFREAIVSSPKPVLTVSHYAYPGGQRPGDLRRRLLPLPETIRAHFHGHAHIGDLVWNKEFPYRRENPIEGSHIHQYNISALENLRSEGSHSAFLHFRDGVLRTIRVRCHENKTWVFEKELEVS
jgi:calcineurin-like phosphoesterase family protein